MTIEAGAGRLITFEGGEGVGKSTQIRLLAETLRAEGREVVETREPGGSAGAEAVRHVLLSGGAEEFGVRMEAILFAAARSDHVEQVIRPSVAAGKVVLCDRFIDSTRVYQGVTGNLEPAFVQTLERIAVNGMMPDLTILIDLPAAAGLARARGRGAEGDADAGPDRFEKEEVSVHENRRQAFLDIAEAEPERFRVVDGSRPSAEIAGRVHDLVRQGCLSRDKGAGPAAPEVPASQ